MTKPEFTVKFLDDGVAPSAILFTDMIGNVTRWDFGDGVLGTWDEPKQRTITHVYKKAGTYAARAIADREESDPYLLIIKGTPVPPVPETLSWWQRLINWLISLLKGGK